MKAIYNRELKSYFTSMMAPLFVAVLVFITGIYFMAYNMRYGYPYFSYTLNSALFIFTFSIPVLTMRSMSEERKQKTDQLLLTAPITVTKMVVGKYLAIITVIAIPCLIFCLCPMIIASIGTAYLKVDYASLFAFFVLGCTFAAIGMFVSSMTESIILAAVGSIGTLFVIYLANGVAYYVPTAAFPSLLGCCLILTIAVILYYVFSKNWMMSMGIEAAGVIILAVIYLIQPELFENLIPNMLNQLALTNVFYSFAEDYVFDVSGMIKLLSIIGICLFLTVQTVQKRRWS